jgi:predicted N-acetyltransferase YhbS
MTPEHLDGAVELSRQVPWPHRREHWAVVQSLSHGIVALEDGRIVATILMTPYGERCRHHRYGHCRSSICGRGLGRQLMQGALVEAGARTRYLVHDS